MKATADIRPKTLEGYAVALRKIVSDAFNIDGGREKFDYRSGGREKLAQAHSRDQARRANAERYPEMETQFSRQSR